MLKETVEMATNIATEAHKIGYQRGAREAVLLAGALETSTATLDGLRGMAEVEIANGSAVWKRAIVMIDDQLSDNRAALAAYKEGK